MPEATHNPDAERYALCLLFEEGNALGAHAVAELTSRMAITDEDFADPLARDAFRAIQHAASRGLSPAEPVLMAREGTQWPTIAPWLKTNEILNPATAETIGETLRACTYRRNVVAGAQRLIAAAAAGREPHELAAQFVTESRSLPTGRQAWKQATEALDEAEINLAETRDGTRPPSVLSGYQALDDATAGFPPTLCVVAAMPGVGKSAFWASVLRNLARRGDSSATFSMEDRAEWLATRYLSHDSKIPQFVLKYKRLSDWQHEQMAAADKSIREWSGRIWIDDRSSLRPPEVLTAARHAYEHLNASLVGLDNMTAMRFSRGQRMDLEIQDFLSDARALANEFKRPFVVLAHVKRRPGLSQGDMPNLTDCSETSGFEKLSRVAFGLARDQDSDMLKVEVLKNTHGKSGIRLELPMRLTSSLLEDT